MCVTLLDRTVDVLVLGETWLNDNVSNSLLQVQGYYLLRYDRKTYNKAGTRKAGGGLCIYIKNKFDLKVHTTVFSSSDDLEIMACSLCPQNQKKIKIIGAYRPPSGKLNAALETLSGVLDLVNDDNRGETIIVGDMNIDFSYQNAPVRKINQLMKKKFLSQLIDVPTRTTRVTSSIIDLIFSDILYVSQKGAFDLNISDHLPVYLIKKKNKTATEYTIIKGRSYRSLNVEEPRSEVGAVNWEEIFQSNNPNVIWGGMQSHFMSIANKHCPERELKIYLERPPYLNDELIALMKDRDDAFKTARRLRDEGSWSEARRLRSRVQTELYRAKREFIARQVELSDGDNRKFWQTIRSAFLKCPRQAMSGIRDPVSNEVLEGKLAADLINSYFCRVSVDLAEKFRNPSNTPKYT